jgi:predicted ATPase/DNA-binding SARP family transcriptional activator
VEARVLGPLEVVGDAGPVPLPASKHRRLLAALLVTPGSPCSADLLTDAVWGDSPPRSAPKLLQVYVSQLRKVLPAPVLIETRAGGYAIDVDEQVLDAARFERLVRDARAARREGSLAVGSALFRRALALWRGRAYDDCADSDLARAQVERLEELRRVVVEERMDAELALGRHREVLPELRSLAREHPLRERLQGQAMLALYRCGHQADALELYRATRRALVEELGVEPGQDLHDLHQRILAQDPTLAVEGPVSASVAGVPVPPNPLRGRDRELGELRAMLGRDDVRLVVLTGAGGSGKTRLAMAAATEVAASFANGAAFVSLAAVQDPAAIASAVSAAVGADDQGGTTMDALATALGRLELLLVLDNMEQLRAAGPSLVDLLARAPRVKLLVTSRVVLHLSGEHVYPVDPLPADPAVELFVERAREANPRLEIEPSTRSVIDALCARLDRLPLAIELAASRVRTLTPTELMDRLGDRLPLLSGGPRDLPARQQTLRATLEWSFEQLDDADRRALPRLSVFAGGCSVAAAEAVCGTTLEQLDSLVDHSLLRHTSERHASRLSMLETVREFVAPLLDASDDADAIRRRHAEHYLRLAGTLGMSVDELGTGVSQDFETARREQDNMRAALDWALHADPVLGVRLMLALEQFWVTSNPHEARQRMTELLDRVPDLPLDLRARALRDLGGSNEVSGDAPRAAEHYRASLDLFEQLGDTIGMLRLQHRLGQVAVVWGKDSVTARRIVEPALADARAGGFTYEESDLLDVLAMVERYDGNVALAYSLRLRSLELSRSIGEWPWGETTKLRHLAELSSLLGHEAEAERFGREAVVISRDSGNRIKTVQALASLAVLARARGDEERAGRLWGGIEAEEARALLGWWLTQRDAYAQLVVSDAGPDFERGRAVGLTQSLAATVAYALD